MIFDLWFALVIGIIVGTVVYCVWVHEVRDIRQRMEEWGFDLPPPANPYPHVREVPRPPYDWEDAR